MSDELTIDELREFLKVRTGGLSAYQRREITKIFDIALDRLAAAVARAEAAEAEHTLALVAVELLQDKNAALGAQLAEREWRPFVDEPDCPGRPEADQDCQVLIEASYVRSYDYRDDDRPGTWLADDDKVLDGLVLAWRPTPPDSDEDGE